ncbi:MAG: LPS export ABC transporter ATP-binding protein [Gammaproteobacteria bacterium]|nr:LPS export ABC transporter ATP-binding protein [Gammaproteobacteria bacterium]
MNTLSAIELAKSYQSRKVVKSVSLNVTSGEVVGLLGPNGAGKTTSFYMIVGLVTCDQGKIKLDEEDVTQHPLHMRAKMGLGYLPQEASIFRKLSVSDNIMAILQTRPTLDNTQRKEILNQLLGELNVTHLSDSMGQSLSGGERRRVEIARTLAAEPKFILLDEPFAGIDPLSVVDIQQIIKQLSERNIGILITDHNVRETLGICDRAYIINEGEVISEGKPDDILKNDRVRDVYLGHKFKM